MRHRNKPDGGLIAILYIKFVWKRKSWYEKVWKRDVYEKCQKILIHSADPWFVVITLFPKTVCRSNIHYWAMALRIIENSCLVKRRVKTPYTLLCLWFRILNGKGEKRLRRDVRCHWHCNFFLLKRTKKFTKWHFSLLFYQTWFFDHFDQK